MRTLRFVPLVLGLWILLITSNTHALDVPLFNQKDYIQRLGTCTKSTIASHGCTVTSKAMVFKYFKTIIKIPSSHSSTRSQRVGMDPAILDDWLAWKGGYKDGCLMNWANDLPGIRASKRQYNSSTIGIDAETYTYIDKALANDDPVIAGVHWSGKRPAGVETDEDWHWVVITSRNENTYNINDPWNGKRTTLKDGELGHYIIDHYYSFAKTLARVEGREEVYWLQNGKLYWVTSWDVIQQMSSLSGWDKVTEYPSNIFDPNNYTRGPRFILTDSRSNGLLVRQKGDYKVYVIENGQRKWITTEEIFNQRAYDWNDVIEVTQAIINSIPEGSPITLIKPLPGKIAFIRDHNLWIMNPDGTEQKQLTTDEKWIGNLRWSPDGKKIAFVNQRGINQGLKVLDTGTGKCNTLVKSEHIGKYFSWLSNTQLIFSKGNPQQYRKGSTTFLQDNPDLYSITIDGLDEKRLTQNQGSYYPIGSPDGSKIIFVYNLRHNRHIIGDNFLGIINSDGAKQKILTEWSTNYATPIWSPDSRNIYYCLGWEGSGEIGVLDLETGEKKSIGCGLDMDLSPSGNVLAIIEPIWPELIGSDTRLITFNLQTHTVKVLVENDVYAYGLSWSSDGKHIAFSRGYTEWKGIWLVDIDGKNLHKIVDSGWQPVWSPPETGIPAEIKLTDKTLIKGEIQQEKIKIRTKYGEMDIPVENFVSIIGQLIKLKDGTTLKGNFAEKTLNVKTDYGELKVETKDIDFITFAKEGKLPTKEPLPPSEEKILVPEYHGVYLVANGELTELNDRFLEIGGLGAIDFETLFKLEDLSGIDVRDPNAYIVFYREYPPTVYRMIVLGELQYDDRSNTWHPGGKEIELKTAPLKGKLGMYKFVPSFPLSPGAYTLVLVRSVGLIPDFEIFDFTVNFEEYKQVSVEKKINLGTVRGRAVDALSGDPVWKMKIVVGGKSSIKYMSKTYRLTGIEPGSYTLKATAPNYYDFTKDIKVETGENIVDIPMKGKEIPDLHGITVFTEPEEKGIQLEIRFLNSKGEGITKFPCLSLDLEGKLYVRLGIEKNYTRGKELFSGPIELFWDSEAFLAKNKGIIPWEKVGQPLEIGKYGILDVVLHTPQGDFKDTVNDVELYTE